MPSKLNKTVSRDTDSTLFDAGKHRNIIVSIEPTRKGSVIGVRLKGRRDTYRIGVGSVYVIALAEHERAIERLARKLVKTEQLPHRSAKARARKTLAEDLKQ